SMSISAHRFLVECVTEDEAARHPGGSTHDASSKPAELARACLHGPDGWTGLRPEADRGASASAGCPGERHEGGTEGTEGGESAEDRQGTEGGESAEDRQGTGPRD